VHGRLRKMAPRYHAMEEVVTRTRAEQDALRGQLADEFAVLKAIFIGKGRDSSWGPKVVELGFAVRTVDRWVVKKLASGRLPSWVEERLRANQSPKPGPDPAALLKTKVAIYLTAAQRSEFLACAEQLGEERLTAAIFRSVVGHPPELPGLTNLSPGLPAFRQTLGNQSTQSGGCNPLSPTDPAGVPPSGGMSTTTALTTNDVPLTPALMKLTRPPQVWDCHAGKDYPADAAYVGCRTIHPFKRHVIREGTIFGNGAEPLASHEGSLHSEVEFRAYAVEKLLDPSFLAEAETLRGRDLLCWCVQNGERRAEFCHARVWLELINNPSGGLRNPNASAEQRRDFDWGYYEPNFLSKAEADALFGMASAQPRTRPTVQRSGHPLRRCASTTWSVWDEHAEPLPLLAGIVDAPPCNVSSAPWQGQKSTTSRCRPMKMNEITSAGISIAKINAGMPESSSFRSESAEALESISCARIVCFAMPATNVAAVSGAPSAAAGKSTEMRRNIDRLAWSGSVRKSCCYPATVR
jgi:hypothetical protein